LLAVSPRASLTLGAPTLTALQLQTTAVVTLHVSVARACSRSVESESIETVSAESMRTTGAGSDCRVTLRSSLSPTRFTKFSIDTRKEKKLKPSSKAEGTSTISLVCVDRKSFNRSALSLCAPTDQKYSPGRGPITWLCVASRTRSLPPQAGSTRLTKRTGIGVALHSATRATTVLEAHMPQ